MYTYKIIDGNINVGLFLGDTPEESEALEDELGWPIEHDASCV